MSSRAITLSIYVLHAKGSRGAKRLSMAVSAVKRQQQDRAFEPTVGMYSMFCMGNLMAENVERVWK
jgi:hypothetical protein